MIAFFTAWTYPKTHQTCNMSHLSKNFRLYCQLQFPPLGGARIKESAFWLITHILCLTFKNLISRRSLNCSESLDIGHAHFHQPFFSPPANARNVANLLFRTTPRRFYWFAPNFAHSICGLYWQRVIKIILIFQTILKLLNNNFLYILLCCISPSWSVRMTWSSGDYFPMSHWGSVKKW